MTRVKLPLNQKAAVSATVSTRAFGDGGHGPVLWPMRRQDPTQVTCEHPQTQADPGPGRTALSTSSIGLRRGCLGACTAADGPGRPDAPPRRFMTWENGAHAGKRKPLVLSTRR